MLRLPEGVKPLGVNPPTLGRFIEAAGRQELRDMKEEGFFALPEDEDKRYEDLERYASFYMDSRVTYGLKVVCGECLDERGRYSRESITRVRRFPGSANVPAMWIDGDVWTERIWCDDPIEPHRVVSLDDRRVQAALETQIMGTPRKRISLVAIEKIANSLTDEQLYLILNDGVYVPTKS